jgi:nitrogen regulatory protein PII
MKMITAILWPDCLETIRDALNPAENQVVSAGPIWSGEVSPSTYRGLSFSQPKAAFRIEIVVPNDLAVDDAVEAILSLAGEAGERKGLVVVSPVDRVVPVSAGAARVHDR